MTPTDSQTLVNEAKRLERLQAKRRKLRRELRLVEDAIKFSRKQVKALASVRADDPDDQLPRVKMRGFGSNKGDQLPPEWKKKGVK